MSFRNTVSLAGLFVVLACYLYFVENPRQAEEVEQKKLLRIDAGAVTEVTLTYPDRQIVLKKTAGGWHMQKPMDVRADQTAVSNLLTAITNAEVKRTLEGEAKALDIYGLDKPEAIVSLKLADGSQPPSVRLGKAAPIGFSAYAQLEGSTEIKLVPSVLQTGMKREVKDLRDKTVVDFKEADVQKIEIELSDSKIEIARAGEGWKIDKPRELKADVAEVNSLLSSLKGIRAEDFIDEPVLADYGLDRPREKIAVLSGKDKTRTELWVGTEKQKDGEAHLFVKRADGDTAFAVPTWTWGTLSKGLSALRDKTVLPFDLAGVGAVEVTRRDGEAYRLVKEAAPAPAAAPTPGEPAPEPTWGVDGAKGSKSAQISNLVADLHGLKGYEIAAEKPADLAPYGLAQPEITFSVIDSAGKPIGRLLASQVGAAESASAYAMSEGGDVVFRLRGFLYAHLDKKKNDLVETVPGPAPNAAPAP